MSMLQLAREGFELNIEVFLMLRAQQKGANAMAFDLMRAVYILQLQGATTEAAWLEAITSSHCDPVWHN